MFDAEGVELDETCPQCGGSDTVTFVYAEGFSELECRTCGFTSEAPDMADLARYRGDLKRLALGRELGDPGLLAAFPMHPELQFNVLAGELPPAPAGRPRKEAGKEGHA